MLYRWSMEYTVFWEGKKTLHLEINGFEVLISTCRKILYHVAQVFLGDGWLIQKQHKISETAHALQGPPCN